MEFYASDVTRITGVRRLRLHQWIERGFLKPSIQEASGHGTRHIYSRADLYKIALFKMLVERGLNRKKIDEIIKTKFRVAGEEDSLEAWLAKGVKDFWFVVARKEDRLSVCIHELAPEHKTYGVAERQAFYGSSDLPPSEMLYQTLRSWFEEGVDDVFIINLSKVVRAVDEKIADLDG